MYCEEEQLLSLVVFLLRSSQTALRLEQIPGIYKKGGIGAAKNAK